MKNKSKILSYIILVLTLILLGLILFMASKENFSYFYDKDTIWIIPYFIILIVFPLILISKKKGLPMWVISMLNGSIVGGGISLIYDYYVLLNMLMLSQIDYWVLTIVLTVYGYSLIILGAIIGGVVGMMKSKAR